MATEQSRTFLQYSPLLSLPGSSPNHPNADIFTTVSRFNAEAPPHTDMLLDLLNRIDLGPHDELLQTILTKIAVCTYSVTTDRLLRQAIEAENEAEWWGRIERSTWSTSYFLLQSMNSNPDGRNKYALTTLTFVFSHSLPFSACPSRWRYIQCG
jgi:hypothetical protein